MDNLTHLATAYQGTFDSERALARRVHHQHPDVAAFVAGKWLSFDGSKLCAHLGDQAVVEAIGLVGDQLFADCELAYAEGDDDLGKKLFKLGHKLHSAAGAAAVKKLCERLYAVAPSKLNANPHLIHDANGVTLDVRDWSLTKTTAEHRNTRTIRVGIDEVVASADLERIAAAAANLAPTWHADLARHVPDAEHRSFLARHAGLGLVGSRTEAALFLTGPSGTYKSTYNETILLSAGDYGQRAKISLLLGLGNQFSTSGIIGSRSIAFAEIPRTGSLGEAFRRLTDRTIENESKGLTPETEPVTWTIFGDSNGMPRVADTHGNMLRRLALVPFNVPIEGEPVDDYIGEHIEPELTGVVLWRLAGLLDYQQRGGLDIPASVKATTREYVASSDLAAVFVKDHAHDGVERGELLESFVDWLREELEPIERGSAGSNHWRQELTRAMTEVGYHEARSNDVGRTRIWSKS